MNVHAKSCCRLICCIVVVILASSFSARYSVAALSSNTNTVQVTDSAYFFSASIPADWRVTRPKDPTSFLRVSAKSSTGDFSVSFYAFRRPGVIELEKFARMDSQFFKNLGPMTDTRNIREYLFWTRAIEKTYGKNTRGLYTLARFESHGSYAYALVAAGSSPDFSAAKNVFKTFHVDIPESAQLAPEYSLEWAKGVVISLLGIAVLYLLGKSGQLVRRGVELKKALKSAQRDATQKGLQINDNVFRRYHRKATWLICAPLLGWSAAYSILMVASPLKIMWPSFFFLLFPLFGYFGFVVVPSDDAADYAPKGL